MILLTLLLVLVPAVNADYFNPRTLRWDGPNSHLDLNEDRFDGDLKLGMIYGLNQSQQSYGPSGELNITANTFKEQGEVETYAKSVDFFIRGQSSLYDQVDMGVFLSFTGMKFPVIASSKSKGEFIVNLAAAGAEYNYNEVSGEEFGGVGAETASLKYAHQILLDEQVRLELCMKVNPGRVLLGHGVYADKTNAIASYQGAASSCVALKYKNAAEIKNTFSFSVSKYDAENTPWIRELSNQVHLAFKHNRTHNKRDLGYGFYYKLTRTDIEELQPVEKNGLVFHSFGFLITPF